jgi:hypothetical protein
MERETTVTVRIGKTEYVVHGFYDADSREFGIDSIVGDLLDYLPSAEFNIIADRAQAEADKQDAERGIEEAAYRGSVER